jgi:hypothetical protein
MLGKIIAHVNRWKTAILDVTEVISEGLHLHKALMALDASLGSPDASQGESYPSPESSHVQDMNYTAMSLCASARYLIYAHYGCNEVHRTAGAERVAVETEALQLSVRGMEDIAKTAVPKIARYMEQLIASPAARPSVGFIPGHSMYYGAIECCAFYKEFGNETMLTSLRSIIDGFQALQSEWRVAGELLSPSLMPSLKVCARLLTRG